MGDNEDYDDSQFPDNDEFVPYTNGAAVASQNGARVVVWGYVLRVSSDGFTMRCCDDTEVPVKLRMPPKEPPSGWVEVWGSTHGRGLVAEDVVPLPEEQTKNIDLEGHKNLAKLLKALEDPWNLGQEKGMTGVTMME